MPNEPARSTHQPSIYQPLDPSREEIRLLTLHPPLKGDPTLRCTLRPAALLSASGAALEPTPYEALSYVWGSPDTSSTIFVNDMEFTITPNLTSILTSLRYATNSRTLWIDAICINQRDIFERAEQVRLMYKVYSSCQRVLAWVEPPPGTSSWYPSDGKDWDRREPISNKQLIVTGMEILKNIANCDIRTIKSSEQNYTQKHQRRHGTNSMRPRRQIFGHPRPSQLTTPIMQLKRENHALSLLLRDVPYWSRAWIVQELSRARKVTLIYGEAQLDWSCISTFLLDEPYFDAFHPTNDGRGGWMAEKAQKEFREIFTKVKVIEDQRRTMHDPTFQSPNGLLDVLTRFRDKESADPRDRIYALLGLVKGGHDIEIDYTKSLEVLYQEVTISLINKSGTLDIICQNPFEHNKGPQALAKYRGIDDAMVRQDRISLPSWTAHFASPSHESTSILFAQRGIFSAGLPKINRICRTIGIKSNVLKVQGTVVGRLSPTEQDWVMQNENNEHGWFRDSMNHIGIYGGSDVYSAWDLLQQMSYKESHDSPTQSNHALTVDVNTRKFFRRTETSMRAFWRTMARDCTAPPNMRRLTEEEIEELHRINTKHIQTAEPLQTCYTYDEFEASVLTYDPRPQRNDYIRSQHIQVSSPPEFQDPPHVDISSWPDLPTFEDPQLAEPPQAKKQRKLDLTRLPYAAEDYMFATTLEGLFVLTRRYVKEGDFVAVLDGGKVPVILRSVPAQIGDEFEELYHFVCIAYVHGIMDGEVEEAVTKGWLEKREILLA